MSNLKQVRLIHSHAICVFIDVKGASDNVNIGELILVLHDIDIAGHFRVIEKFL